MGINTDISWADATVNLWIGCTKVGPGCDHCYAARDNARYGWVRGADGAPAWGQGVPRRRTSPGLWANLKSWNKNPERVIASRWPARKPRVFLNSLSDFFDNEIDLVWRIDAWRELQERQNLDFIIVTKRIPNVEKMLPENWSKLNFSNVILLVTVVNQDEADRDVPRLLSLKRKYPWLRVGLSIEPMLGRIDLTRLLTMSSWEGQAGPVLIDALGGKASHASFGRDTDPVLPTGAALDWVILGFESGGKEARPGHPDWVRQVQKACAAAGVPFHFKQWGAWLPRNTINVMKDHGYWVGDVFNLVRCWGDVHDKRNSHVVMERVGDKSSGRELDGTVYDGFVKAA